MTKAKTPKKKKSVGKKVSKKTVVESTMPIYNGVKNIQSPTDISSIQFVYFGATNLEEPGSFGISHLMEHLICKRFDKMMDALQSESVQWNAYTSDNKIVFEFTGLEECLKKFRPKIIKAMYSPFTLSEASLKKEKSIVCEEYDGIMSSLSSAHFFLFMRRHFNHFSAIGRKSDIEKFTVAQCKEFYEKQFSSPDIIINLSKTFTLSEEGLSFGSRYWLAKEIVKTVNPDDKEVEIVQRLLAGETKNLFFFQEIAQDDLSLASIVSIMLSNGLNSPLYQEVREKRGLVYSISSEVGRFCALGGFLISSQCSSGNVKEVTKVTALILKNKKKHLTEARLELVRRQIDIERKLEQCRIGDASTAASPAKKELFELLKTVNIKQIHAFCEKYLSDLKKFTCVEVF